MEENPIMYELSVPDHEERGQSQTDEDLERFERNCD